MPLSSVSTDAIVQFLSIYEDKPWRKRSFYLALRTFWKWVSITYDTSNPFLDRFGNLAIDIPRTPSRLLYTLEPRQMSTLIEAASNARNKAIVSLWADSGGRRNEITNIQVKDVDLERCRIRVWGKGNKEGWLIFGSNTHALLVAKTLGQRTMQIKVPIERVADVAAFMEMVQVTWDFLQDSGRHGARR